MRNGIQSFVRRNLLGLTVSGTNQNRPAPGTTTGFHITPPIPHHETPGELDPAITCRGCQPPRGRLVAGTAVTVVVVAHAKFVKSSTGCGQSWRPPSNDCRNCRTRWRRCEPSWPNSPTCDRWPRTRARPPAGRAAGAVGHAASQATNRLVENQEGRLPSGVALFLMAVNR